MWSQQSLQSFLLQLRLLQSELQLHWQAGAMGPRYYEHCKGKQNYISMDLLVFYILTGRQIQITKKRNKE